MLSEEVGLASKIQEIRIHCHQINMKVRRNALKYIEGYCKDFVKIVVAYFDKPFFRRRYCNWGSRDDTKHIVCCVGRKPVSGR